jgi:GNAT superfamily N-acetyltransferase
VSCAMDIRVLHDSESDLDRADRLLTTAYRPPSWRQEVEVYLRTQPDGWFVVEEAGEIVAMAGGLAYGSFAWLGLVATLPGWERRGFASRLSARVTEWATDRGCATVALDASEKGRPVYERLGFQPVGETVVLIAPLSPPPADEGMAERIDDIDQLLLLDRSVFGGDRAALLRSMSELESPDIYVVREADGIAGYLLSREGALGPGCARSPAVAERLLLAALPEASSGTHGDVRLLLPTESAYGDVLRSLGFERSRSLTHMRLGEQTLPGDRQLLIAQTSLAAG